MSDPDPAELWREVLGWLRVAENDRRVAQLCLDATPPAWEGAAYHCQQAAEKLLKGFLVRADTDFGRTHDLEHLGYLVVRQFPAVHPLVEPLAAWTHWAVAYRYPDNSGPEPQPTLAELQTALALIAELQGALHALAPDPPTERRRPSNKRHRSSAIRSPHQHRLPVPGFIASSTPFLNGSFTNADDSSRHHFACATAWLIETVPEIPARSSVPEGG